MQLGGKEIIQVKDAPGRMAMILWGDAGFGKTTLACTAPGKKLLVNFDPDGYLSIKGWDDVYVSDQSTLTDVTKFRDALGLERVLKEGDFDTVIFDSLTMVEEKSLAYGISKGGKSTIEEPGWIGFGARTGYTRELVRVSLDITNKYNKHVIYIAHEGTPDKDKDGNITSISMLLGGAVPNAIGARINEIWYLNEKTSTGKKYVAIRPIRLRKPMKTRMFLTNDPKNYEFEWKFNPETREGEGIETWFNRWRDNGFNKIEVPK